MPAGTQAPDTHMHLWGINAGSQIYYRDYVVGKPARWIKVPGQLYRVSVSADGNHIWGINGVGNIYYRQGFKGSWQLVPGKLHKSIAVSGDGSHVWGVNKQMMIYYRAGFSGTWQKVPGALVKISVSQCGGHVWGVNKEDNIYYRPGFGGSWVHVHGKLKQIAVSANGAHVWGVNRFQDIFYRAAGAASWTKVPGKLISINVSGDGRYVWGTNKGHDIFFKDFSLGLMSAWTKTTFGKLVYISVSNHWVTLNGNIQTKPAIIDGIDDVDDDDDSVDLIPDGPDSDIESDGEETDVDDEEPPYGNYNPDPEDSDSDSDDDIDGAGYEVDDPDDDDAPKNGKFTCVPGKFIMVNVSLDGKHVWGCTTDFKVYYRTGVNGEWQEVDAPPMQWVSVSGDGSKVYGVTANDKGRCFFRDGGFIGEWKQIDGFMKQICVSANGEHVWGVNYDELVFYRKGGGYEGVPSWKVDGLHASHITVSANGDHVWGLQSKVEFPRIFHRQGYGAGSADEWEDMGGCAQTIHCSDAKTCWSVNAASNVYERLPEDTVGRKWKRVDGYMEQISVSENAEHVWAVDPDGNVWYFGSEELV